MRIWLQASTQKNLVFFMCFFSSFTYSCALSARTLTDWLLVNWCKHVILISSSNPAHFSQLYIAWCENASTVLDTTAFFLLLICAMSNFDFVFSNENWNVWVLIILTAMIQNVSTNESFLWKHLLTNLSYIEKALCKIFTDWRFTFMYVHLVYGI